MSTNQNAVRGNALAINFERKVRRTKEDIANGVEETVLNIVDQLDLDSFNYLGLLSKAVETELYKYAQLDGAITDDAKIANPDHFYGYLNSTLISQRFGTEDKKAAAAVVMERLIEKGADEGVAQLIHDILATATLTKVKAQRPQDAAKMVEFLKACEQETYADQYQAWIDAEVQETQTLDLSSLTL